MNLQNSSHHLILQDIFLHHLHLYEIHVYLKILKLQFESNKEKRKKNNKNIKITQSQLVLKSGPLKHFFS